MTPTLWLCLACILATAAIAWWGFCRPVGRALEEARRNHDTDFAEWKRISRIRHQRATEWTSLQMDLRATIITLHQEAADLQAQLDETATRIAGLTVERDGAVLERAQARERLRVSYLQQQRLLEMLNGSNAERDAATTQRDTALARADVAEAKLARFRRTQGAKGRFVGVAASG